jgi:hypothetical protein
MFVSEILEGLLGATVKGKSGGGILSESKEAIFGGCFGLLMSTAFFFCFFTAGLALIFGVTYRDYALTGATVPLILILGASGFLSPFIGMMFGLQGGRYSATQHFGCFVIYLSALLGGIGAVSVLL